MTRQHLYTAILNAARRSGVDEIFTGSEVDGATPECILRTKTGREYKADLIIGADGVRSAVRDSLNMRVERVTIRDFRTPTIQQRLRQNAFDTKRMTAKEFASSLEREYRRWEPTARTTAASQAK